MLCVVRRSFDSTVWLPASLAGFLQRMILPDLTQLNQADILMKVLRGEWFYGVDTTQWAAGG